MAKGSMIAFVALALVFCGCQTQGTDIGPLNIKVHKLSRKTKSLQREVDDIWEKILSPKLNVPEFGNKTRTDNEDDYVKECVAKVNDSVSSVKELKSEVKHLVVTSRNGQKNEKQWQRETIRNFTKMFEDFQTNATTMLDEDVHDKFETINTELNERRTETKTELKHVNTSLDELRDENQVLRQYILEIQNENERNILKIQNENERNILKIQNDNKHMKSELIKLQATLSTTSSSSSTTTTTTTTTTPTSLATTTKPLLSTCNEGWEHFRGHCYLVVLTRKNWDEASDYCKSQEGYQVEIASEEERRFVAELLIGSGYRYYHRFWTGATDRAEEGRFVYENSHQLVPETYWDEGQPNNYGGNQHCVYMVLSRQGLVFGDEECNDSTCPVCEKP